MAKLTNVLTSIFLIFIILQMAPTIVKTFKSFFEEALETKIKVGLLKIKDSITESAEYNKNLRKFFEQKDIKAILLHVESGGGSSGHSQAVFNEINILKKEHPKPIITLSNELCASGAYYIACATDHIITTPMAIVGSVGSYIGTLKIKDFLENWKLKYDIKQSGKYKTALNSFTQNTPEVDALIQETSDDTYKQFMNDVAAHRKLSLSNSDKWANGKFFTGKQAKALGLIDELGSESNAIKKIKELTMAEKDKQIEFVVPAKTSKYEKLFGMEDDDKNISLVNMIVDKICAKLGFDEHPKSMLNAN